MSKSVNSYFEELNLHFGKIVITGYSKETLACFALCQREKIPIIVFNIECLENIEKIIRGEDVGTFVY